MAALRERWGGAGSFAHFVTRQARLALERAERPLLGYRYKVPKHVVEAIQDSPEFRREVATLAARLGAARVGGGRTCPAPTWTAWSRP